jgi:hypothetical protein
MVEVGWNRCGDLGALAFFHGCEKMNAHGLVGVLLADFELVARFWFQTQENLYGFSDVMAGKSQGFCGRALRLQEPGKREQQKGSGSGLHFREPLYSRLARSVARR